MNEQNRWTEINSFQMCDAEGSLTYVGNSDLMTPESGGGTDCGKVMIRLEVDGDGPVVYTDLGITGDMAGLMAAATALHRAIAQLTEFYPADGSERLGRCLGQGDWGRCRGKHGHDGEHLFPSKETWQEEYDSFQAAKAAKAAGAGSVKSSS